MKFVADEGVDFSIVVSLREAGYVVKYIAEDQKGISDIKVLNHANNLNHILITRDKDFGELVFRDKKVHSGIILERLGALNSKEKASLVLEVVNNYKSELIGSFTVITVNKIRIRKL